MQGSVQDRGIQIEIPGESNKVGGSSDKKKSALVTGYSAMTRKRMRGDCGL